MAAWFKIPTVVDLSLTALAIVYEPLIAIHTNGVDDDDNNHIHHMKQLILQTIQSAISYLNQTIQIPDDITTRTTNYNNKKMIVTPTIKQDTIQAI